MTWSPATCSASITQSTQASASARIGAPDGAGRQPIWPKRSTSRSCPTTPGHSSGTVVGDRESLVGGQHLAHGAVGRRPRVLDDAVERVVVARRVVMEEREAAGAGLGGDTHRVVDGAVS